MGWILATVGIGLLGFILRAACSNGPYGISDEIITVGVVGHMRQSGDWDTNWAKAEVPDDLRYDQYNFSSHLYATYFFYRFVKLLPGTLDWRSEGGGLRVYRLFSVLLGSLVVWQTMRLAQRMGGRMVALGAGLLTAVATQLVQDAHYVRPEAFTTVLTLAAVTLSWPRAKPGLGQVAAGGLVVGLLVACKVSMLLLAWLPLVPLMAVGPEGRKKWVGWVLAPSAIAAGFAVGAPGAVAHPSQFLNGVQYLLTQYSGVHPPHSHLGGGPVVDMLGRFYGATLGWPLLACGVLGVVILAWQRRWAGLILVAGPWTLFMGYFATKSVFFERNLSHVLPLLFILVAQGVVWLAEAFARRVRMSVPVLAALLFGLLIVRPASLTVQLVWWELSGRASQARGAFEAALRERHPAAVLRLTSLLVDAQLEDVAAHFRSSQVPLLLNVADYRDEWTASCLRRLAQRYVIQRLSERAGSFPTVPTSTLLTYHSWHDHYFLVTGMRSQ